MRSKNFTFTKTVKRKETFKGIELNLTVPEAEDLLLFMRWREKAGGYSKEVSALAADLVKHLSERLGE